MQLPILILPHLWLILENKGEEFEIERKEKILFKDFLDNHAFKKLKIAYEKFKESSKKLYELVEKFIVSL